MHICIVKIKDPVHSTGFVSLLEGRTDWYKDLMAFLFFFFCVFLFFFFSLFGYYYDVGGLADSRQQTAYNDISYTLLGRSEVHLSAWSSLNVALI